MVPRDKVEREIAYPGYCSADCTSARVSSAAEAPDTISVRGTIQSSRGDVHCRP